MRLCTLLLLSLPLLLLSGLAEAEDANGKARTTNGTANGTMPTTPPITSPTTSLGPPPTCLAGGTSSDCTKDSPFCAATVTLKLDSIFNPRATAEHGYVYNGCQNATGHGCIVALGIYAEANPVYMCYCDSRINDGCTEERLIKYDLIAIAVEMYKVAHSTTPPPTTTPDPKHYCLVGADKKLCPASSFCGTKIFLNPFGIPINKTGLDCVEQLPAWGRENNCSKNEPFNISVPLFDCFCKSVAGRACNNLEKDKARDTNWTAECATIFGIEKKDAEKKKDEQMKNEIDKVKNESGDLPIGAIVGGGGGGLLALLVIFFVVGGIIYWKCRKTVVIKEDETDMDRQIRTDAQNCIKALNKVVAATVMKMWYDFTGKDNEGGNAPASEQIPKDVFDKDVIHIVNLPLVIASMVDPQLPDGKKMHWNFVNDEKTLIAAMLPHFFLSAVHLGVACIVQLTRRKEKTDDADSDMAEYLPQGKTKFSFCKGVIGKTSIAVHVVDVEAKPSFMRRRLEVDVKEDETGKSVVHSIEHFQYFDWKDHNLPIERGGILDFTEQVFKYATYENKCTLVHCRGGIGRTGAFLVCLTMLRRAFDGKQLTTEEVFGIAKSIRLRRCRAIQKPTQLAFALYIAAYTLIQLADLPPEKLDFIKSFGEQCNIAITDAQVKQKNKEEQEKAEKAKAEPPK